MNWYKAIFFILFLLVVFLLTAVFLFWQETQKFEPNIYYYVPPERSFVYSQEELKEFGIEEYIKEKITVEKNRLIKEKRSFIDLNLKEMKLTLYKQGEVFEVFPVKSKGKEGSWWETPPGAYFVGDKIVNHFSTIAGVWAPYAVQFYGNFFIHGWPYYTSGWPLSPGPSGGCVRLRTEDAVIVFKFAERGMPVLIYEEKINPPLPDLKMIDPEMLSPKVKGQSFLVADLKTGEIVIDKEMNSEIYAGSIAGGMLALTASEVVNLEKRITAKDWMIENIGEGIIFPGRSYRAYDLLYPLLRQSSKESALVLSRFLTPELFLAFMNAKAQAIGMNNTKFVDITGDFKENTTTLYDVARMMRYIKDYRSFIFNISDNWTGLGSNDKETVFKIMKTKELDGVSRVLFIGVADSSDIKTDLENILVWLNNNFNLKYKE